MSEKNGEKVIFTIKIEAVYLGLAFYQACLL